MICRAYSVRLPAFLCLMTTLLPASLAQAVIEKAAEAFPLRDVQLLDSPFKEKMERNAKYLLSIEPDRLLHNTRKYAGLTPKGELYGGWESRGIAGHTLGHYLTAISQQYAATGDQRFGDRIEYIVGEMAECQKAYGDGYVGALPPLELETMRGFAKGIVEPTSPFNFKGGAWVPWYTQHKVLAGLKDAWLLRGSAKAREVTLRLADWVDDITKNLSPEQQQKMLQVEYGGMNETLVEIYALTGEKRYLEASRRFYHKAVLDPLAAGRDELAGKHANTQIPKIIGEARDYEVTGEERGRRIAECFWDTVVHRRSWANGGNSDHEHFFSIGKAREHLGPVTSESCNTYNMLNLTEHLFSWHPSVELADYYERALYSHILASQEPKQGMFTYFISFKPGHFMTYSTPFDAFWCCVGSGMENHTKYGEAIYFRAGDGTKLYVNLFIPSVLTWKERGLVIEQRTSYPNEDFTDLTIQSAPADSLALLVRCPAWTATPVGFRLNGQPLDVKSQPGQYAEISRIWKTGDHLRVTIPMALRTEQLENDPNKIAFLYGPTVLAGDLGPVAETKSFPYAKDQGENFHVPGKDAPVLVRAGDDLLASIKRVPSEPLAFRTEEIGRPEDVTLRPFTDLSYNYYNVYWDVFSPSEWKTRQAALEAEKARQAREDARIVDELRFGEQQPEIDHRLTSDRSKMGDFRDRKWRDAADGGYLQFEMKVLAGTPQVLRCTYWGGDAGNREFDILINGKLLKTEKLNRSKPGMFFQVEYPIPAALPGAGNTLTVRFQPKAGNTAGRIFDCAILKAAE